MAIPTSFELNKINKLGEEQIKPQIKYQINDFENDISLPFVPKIKEKHNALVQIQESIIKAQQKLSSFLNNLPVFFNLFD